MSIVDAARRVQLPGGFADARDHVHAEVELVPLTGEGEAILLESSHACAASLTTALLLQSVRRIGSIRRVTEDVIRDLLVQDRDFLIVRLREITVGRDMWVQLQCPREACGEGLELKLALDELPLERRPVVSRYVTWNDMVEMRLPTGADQEWVAEAGVADAPDASRRLLSRCLRHRRTHRAIDASTLDDEECERIEARMRELAPDVTPELDAICPTCREPFSAEVDLAFLVLAEMRSRTRRLEEEIHLLAWHYHWPERDILAMSRQKRARYVRLVQDQLETLSLSASAGMLSAM